MSTDDPQPEIGAAVVDTVVVNYFVAVGAFELLREILGGCVHVPRTVFDPDEPDDGPEELASELRRGLWLHRRRVDDEAIAPAARERSVRALPAFEQLPGRAHRGELIALDLAPDELRLYAQLRETTHVARFSLITPLGRGEAAALALAVHRGLSLLTDDEDAIRVARDLDVEIQRIRGLLTRAARSGLIDFAEAKRLHAAMKAAGFWDKGTLGHEE